MKTVYNYLTQGILIRMPLKVVKVLFLMIVFLGLIIAASSLIAASFVGCHQTVLAVFFLSFALIGSGCLQSGFSINHLDIGARYAGVLMAITNTAGTVSGIVSPFVVGQLTNNKVGNNSTKIILINL